MFRENSILSPVAHNGFCNVSGSAVSPTSEASAIQRLEASLAKVETSSLPSLDMSRSVLVSISSKWTVCERLADWGHFYLSFRTTQGSLPVTQQMTEMSISRKEKPEHLEPGKAHCHINTSTHTSTEADM